MNRDSILHVSDLTGALQCPRRAWLRHHQPEDEWKLLHPDSREFKERFAHRFEKGAPCGQPWDSAQRSKDLLNEYGKGKDLRFEYDRIRTSIPYLEKQADGTYLAIVPFAARQVREHSLVPLMLTRFLARKNGVPIAHHQLITLESDYIRQDPVDENELFVINAPVFRDRGGRLKDDPDALLDALEARIDPKTLIEHGHLLFEGPCPIARRTRACSAPSRCPFYSSCWHDDRLPDDAPEFYAGRLDENDALRGSLGQMEQPGPSVSSYEYAQIQAACSENGIFLDPAALAGWMEELVWPLCYLDFEWETFACPPYEGMKPFDVLCFQYSLIIEEKDGTCIRRSFSGIHDCRRQFIEHLLKDLPQTGSIVVFNREGAEQLRLQQLADQFEEYRQPLEALQQRMVDLAAPFESGACYDIRQRGKSSLKTLLPLFSDCSYDSLDIHNGMEAVYAYRAACQASSAKSERIAEAIDEYCMMDVLAEQEVLHGLQARLQAARQDKTSGKEETECQV